MSVLLPHSKKRGITVLFAEDEAMMRDLITTFLLGKGFSVIVAENGRDAVAKARDAGLESIGLLITDLVMPEMGGMELSTEMRTLKPGLRVLFISGYTDDLVVLNEEGGAKSAFLRKPFSFQDLGRSIEGLLAD